MLEFQSLYYLLYIPGLSSSIAGKLAGGSFISKVLLANADALCAAASPLLEEEIPLYVLCKAFYQGIV